ncbi:hypothetical protein [Paenibacillus cymbidii]|uniref:hypothetical protein n=1 Tax=Paenibacillus cymbidii TaxID=1639034 RepID=UPI001436CB18|nr:hypothetical protein [Paenibacillus cymbidii]
MNDSLFARATGNSASLRMAALRDKSWGSNFMTVSGTMGAGLSIYSGIRQKEM